MVSPIAPSSVSLRAHAPVKAKLETNTAENSPGRSSDAIGQQAKTAISQAGDTAALPKNIQGKVASALARGLSIEALLSIQDSADSPEAPVSPEPSSDPIAPPPEADEPMPDLAAPLPEPDEPAPDLAAPLTEPDEPIPEPTLPLPDPEVMVDLSQDEAEPVVTEPSQVADPTDNPA